MRQSPNPDHVTPFPAVAVEARSRGLWRDALRRLAGNRLATAGAVFVLLTAAVAAFAPLIDRYPPNQQDATASFEGPSARHWLGTDQLGRDQYSRLVNGARVSLSVGILTQIVAVSLGLAVGLAAGLGFRTLDNLLMRFTDVVYAFPDLLFVILLVSVFREAVAGSATRTLVVIFVAIGLVSWPNIARLVRGQILSLRQQEFVRAAEALGASRLRVALVHLLPNTLGPVIVTATFGIPAAIFAEAGLAFIGLGLPPPTPSWGRLVADGYDAITNHSNLVLAPALAIAALMMAFTFLGDGLRDALDPRLAMREPRVRVLPVRVPRRWRKAA
jgi:oligopeptide transport system permease protein